MGGVMCHSAVARRHGNNIYVATTGTSGGPGTLAAPYQTLAQAEAVVAAGQNIVMRGGTYNISGNLHLSVAGTAGKPITVMSYGGETAVLNGTGSSAGGNYLIIDATATYRTLLGLTIQNWFNAPSFFGANPIINSCLVQHIWDNGIIFQGTSGSGSCVNAIAINNHTFSTSENNSAGGGSFGQGITFVESDNGTAINNLVERSFGEGIGVIQAQNCLIQGNTVKDAWSVCLYNDSARSCSWIGNFAYATGNTGGGGNPADGFALSQERFSRGWQMTNTIVQNNIIMNCKTGMRYFISLSGHAPQNTIFTNNTVVNNTVGGNFSWSADTGGSGNVYRNNLHYMSSAGTNVSGATSQFTAFDHNSWFNGSAGVWAGTGDVTSNPNLVAPATLTAISQRPQVASPVLGGGTPTNAPLSDYIGDARDPTGPSIGAWEHS